MSKAAKPYQKWMAKCPDKECEEELIVEYGLEWIWCNLCEKDYDLDIEVIRSHEDKK
jgi:hypothetical protein